MITKKTSDVPLLSPVYRTYLFPKFHSSLQGQSNSRFKIQDPKIQDPKIPRFNQVNLEVSEVSITYVTNRGKAEVMLHIGAGQSRNYQIILELFGYDIFCNNLKRKKNLK